MSKRLKYLTIFLLIFIFFQFYKFIKIRITNLDLPKGKIVFSSDLHGDSEIYIMNLNGTELRRLTRHSIFGTTPDTWITDARSSFSPDGENIVFDSNRDDKGPRRKITRYSGWLVGEESLPTFLEIYIMNSNGSNHTRLTYNQVNNFAPVFSSDGKRILFSVVPSIKNPFYEQIKIINPDGTGERIIASGRLISRSARFSPDSKKVFFVSRGDLYTVDINTGNLIRLTQFNLQNIEAPDAVESLLYIEDYAISPDGQNITLVTRERKCLQFILYSMKANGSNLKEIFRLNNPSNLLYIAIIEDLKYSPDGQKVALIADFNLDNKLFYILDRNNNLTFIKNLNDLDMERDCFIFTPDNKRIIFIVEYPYGLFNDWYAWVKSTIHNVTGNLGYSIFRRLFTVPFDNKYLCIMDIDGRNFRKITKLPVGAEFGRDFIHWEK
ncbi:MAG: hypothetical protein Q8N62_08010 [Candidatus Omnitrophota bacterium]|nr:hypothetical protein [Candidatus Omnitrophota bacterium]